MATSVTGEAHPVVPRGREVPLSIPPTPTRTLTSTWFSPQGRVKLPSHSDVSLASPCLSGSHPPLFLPPLPLCGSCCRGRPVALSVSSSSSVCLACLVVGREGQWEVRTVLRRAPA